MDVAVRRNAKLHKIAFSRGRVERELEVAPLEERTTSTGTLVTFLPDTTIFKAGFRGRNESKQGLASPIFFPKRYQSGLIKSIVYP